VRAGLVRVRIATRLTRLPVRTCPSTDTDRCYLSLRKGAIFWKALCRENADIARQGEIGEAFGRFPGSYWEVWCEESREKAAGLSGAFSDARSGCLLFARFGFPHFKGAIDAFLYKTIEGA
jgi:hypothetical protein